MRLRADSPSCRASGWQAPAALALAAAAWGSTFVVNKAALAELGPFTILAIRFPLAVAVLIPVAKHAGVTVRRALTPRLLLFGLPLAGHFGLQTAGLALTTASRGALIVAAVPVATAVGALVLLGERLGPRVAAGIAVSVTGVVLLVGSPGPAGEPGVVVGDLLIAGSVLAWAVYTVQGRRLAAGYTALEATIGSTLGATLVFVPAAVIEWHATGPPRVTAGSAALVVYLALVPSAAAFLAWNWGLQHVPASSAGPFVNLVPVTGVGFGLLAGETLGRGEVVAAAVVAVGLWLSQSGSRHGPRHPGPAGGEGDLVRTCRPCNSRSG